MLWINTAAVIASGGNNDGSHIGFGEGLLVSDGIGAAADTHADDIGAVGCGIVDALDDGGDVTGSVALDDGDGHDIGIRVGTRYADAVVAHSGSDAGTVGAMAVVIAHAGTIVDKVPAVNIVLEAVVIVVSILGTCGLERVGPNVVGQVGMLDIHARVDDSDDGALGRDFIHCPQLRQIDGTDAILLRIIGFLGILLGLLDALDELQVVGLGKFHLGNCLELFDGVIDALCLGLVELEAIQFAQVALDNVVAIVGLHAARLTLDGPGEGHQLLGLFYAQGIEDGIDGVDTRGTEFAVHTLDIHG